MLPGIKPNTKLTYCIIIVFGDALKTRKIRKKKERVKLAIE